MKKLLIISFVIILLIGLELNAKPRFGVSFNYFYSSLSPYGEWIQVDADIFAWRPHNIHRSWKPYSYGSWSWTRNGWYWDSDEPFGWAVYHYGRWYDDDYYGWIWIPDYEWGPAWVEWRYNDDYVGWAPLPPYASFHINFGIRFSIGWSASHRWWNFVPYHRFCNSHLDYYILDYNRTSRIFGSTRYRNNYYYDRDRIVNGGIDRSFIESRSGYRIAERELRNVDNRNDFERSRGRDRDGIVSYRPSDREMREARTPDNLDIRRSDRSTTLERDKVSISRMNPGERNYENRSEDIRQRDVDRESRINENNQSRREIDIQRNERNNESDQYIQKEQERINSQRQKQIETERNSERERIMARPDVQNRNESERNREIERSQPQNRRFEAPQRNNERRVEPNVESQRSRVESNESRAESRNQDRGERSSGRESRGSVERRR